MGEPLTDPLWFDLEVAARAAAADLRRGAPGNRASAAAWMLIYGGLEAVDPCLRNFVARVFPLAHAYTIGCCQGHPEGGAGPHGVKRPPNGYVAVCTTSPFTGAEEIATIPGVTVRRWPKGRRYIDYSVTISFPPESLELVTETLLRLLLEMESSRTEGVET